MNKEREKVRKSDIVQKNREETKEEREIWRERSAQLTFELEETSASLRFDW
jgi:hypothetical protein